MGEPIRVICGPTAAGKSALALRLATEEPLTVISADSRQIYRGFDIGTAKPGAADQARLPHRGIDIVDPDTRYSAAAWSAAARGWIEEARAAGRVPVVVGGTGFYLRALFEPLFEEPEIPPAERRALAAELESMSSAELRRWVASLDPARAHLGRTQLVRAIEVALLTGERISDLHRTASRASSLAARYLVVDPGAALRHRIEDRVEEMLAAGWEDEVRTLVAGVPPEAPAWNASGYRAIRDLATGAMERDVAIVRVVIETRQYAKRQRTWFRHQLAGGGDVVRIDPTDPGALEVVRRWWLGEGERGT